jgi:pectin methylesterase-like acyl-CoA thioesterase
VVALGASAAAASAANVNIVRQSGPPGGEIPPNTHYYTTIQAAVNASHRGDWVLIEPGGYYEPVKVTSAQSGIWIRGMNRNNVIVDGQERAGNGIEIFKADDVWVENLTVRNFDTGCSGCGNEIWWNGGSGSGQIGARGWYGAT